MDYTQPTYQAQLAQKAATTLAEFRPYGITDLQTFPSPIQHYRMRAEFRVWHDGEDLYYIMFDKETREKYRVDQFPAASETINALMPLLLDAVRDKPTLRHKLFQVDFLTALSGEVVLSLLYHRQLDPAWEEGIATLRQSLAEQGHPVSIIGRARKQKIVIGKDSVTEQLTVHGRTLTYQQVENSFTQPNAIVAQHMLEWAISATADASGDLLELYCGNGNFSIALAPNFRRVLATELAKPSVESAQWNIAANAVPNLKIARLSAEEFTEAMEHGRSFRRLQQQDIALEDYDFQTVLVDPPRAGMDEAAVEMIRRYDTILYISCNPATLLDNIAQLADTHAVGQLALFDQFPYTPHREVGVVLRRK